MPFMKMSRLAVSLAGEDWLLANDIVHEDALGCWRLRRGGGVPLMSSCFYLEHETCFENTYTGPGALFDEVRNNSPGVEEQGVTSDFVDAARGVIWEVYGAEGKKNAPAYDAFGYHIKRADAVFQRWWGAFLEEMPDLVFEGKGWVASIGDKEVTLPHDNMVLQFSGHALMDDNNVKGLTCNCSPEVTPNER